MPELRKSAVGWPGRSHTTRAEAGAVLFKSRTLYCPLLLRLLKIYGAPISGNGFCLAALADYVQMVF